MKKAVTILLILICTVTTALSLRYAVRGSLEEFPTGEQHDKARLVFGFLSLAFVLLDALLIKRAITRAKRNK